MAALLATIARVTIDELAANREWLPGVRASWEAKGRVPLSSMLDGLPGATNASLVQCMMRLLNLTLDYFTDSQAEMSQEQHERYISVAAVLGKEWTGVLDSLSNEERLWTLGNLSLYYHGIAHVLRQASGDSNLTGFLGIMLLTWGAFYSRVEFR